jgi:hypothetical protein
MPLRTLQEALDALDEVTYRNEKEETDYTHQIVHYGVAPAVDTHADFVASQARGLAERLSGYGSAMDELGSAVRDLAKAVKRGEIDPLVAQQRWRALELRREQLKRIVDERDSAGSYRLQEQAVSLLLKLDEPLRSLDDIQRKYPSLRRHFNH